MNLKHFFKPNWEKVVILVVLAFFYYLFSFFLEFVLFKAIYKYLYLFLVGSLIIFNPFFFSIFFLEQGVFELISLVIFGLIYWYFLACIIDQLVFRDERKNIRFFYGLF